MTRWTQQGLHNVDADPLVREQRIAYPHNQYAHKGTLLSPLSVVNVASQQLCWNFALSAKPAFGRNRSEGAFCFNAHFGVDRDIPDSINREWRRHKEEYV
jgi:hypothetical protein